MEQVRYSDLTPVDTLTGDELVAISQADAEGRLRSRRITVADLQQQGPKGDSLFDIARRHGYAGDEQDFLAHMRGAPGKSLYVLAREQGFEGSEAEFVDSMRGKDGDNGLDAYQLAVKQGFTGTRQQWLDQLGDHPELLVRLEAQHTTLTGKLDRADFTGEAIRTRLAQTDSPGLDADTLEGRALESIVAELKTYTDQKAGATGLPAPGDVGSYVLASFTPGQVSFGSTISGSNLRQAGLRIDSRGDMTPQEGPTLAGTWTVCSYADFSGSKAIALCQRIE